MALVVDDGQNSGFSFIWTIQNFSYCLQKTDEHLESPRFTLKSNNSERLFLCLLPRGWNNNDSVCIGLRRTDVTKELLGDFVFSIRTVGGSYKKILSTAPSQESQPGVFWVFLKKEEIFKKGTDAILDNDTLTIRCRIIKVDDIILESEQCYARTVVKVERVIYTWNLKTLSDLRAKEPEATKQINLPKIKSFTLNVSVTKGILGEDKLEMKIKRANTNQLCFSTCEISLLDTGKVLHSQQNEHWFEKSTGEQIWTISFAPKTNFLTNSKLNSTIHLHCEFVVSFGVYSAIEKMVNGSIAVDSVVISEPKLDSDTFGSCSSVDRPLGISKPAMDSDILGSWKNNLRCFYSEGEFSDLTIRTPRKEFPVHKAMLCAQSPVFHAMFKRDMKENRSGVVEIEDLDDDTVSMMLLFVYTSSVENLDWEKASKLYFAADKYEMTALKEECSVFLKEHLSSSNACTCLILADTHQDQDLKSVVQDFIIENSTDIISSDEWKELMTEKSLLAAETMHVMFMRNLKV